MSFMLTTQQMYERKKTVTRRNGWCFVKPGDVIQAVEKCQGLRKGEKVVKICLIRIVDTKGEALKLIGYEPNGCLKEGFPHMRPADFIDMFMKSHKGVGRHSIINQIEFEFID